MEGYSVDIVLIAVPHGPPGRKHRITSELSGADDGTRTRTLKEKQIFMPLRLSPPPSGVRGLDCPFAMTREPQGTRRL